mmetsp:Transcript_18358/g.37041  ORF Transcript_18358/g.37041 Transcript_18358/m.37041 type:complete len:117 (+) Transcript_18358:145-495(+)
MCRSSIANRMNTLHGRTMYVRGAALDAAFSNVMTDCSLQFEKIGARVSSKKLSLSKEEALWHVLDPELLGDGAHTLDVHLDKFYMVPKSPPCCPLRNTRPNLFARLAPCGREVHHC